jgi:hypothetical protein
MQVTLCLSDLHAAAPAVGWMCRRSSGSQGCVQVSPLASTAIEVGRFGRYGLTARVLWSRSQLAGKSVGNGFAHVTMSPASLGRSV